MSRTLSSSPRKPALGPAVPASELDYDEEVTAALSRPARSSSAAGGGAAPPTTPGRSSSTLGLARRVSSARGLASPVTSAAVARTQPSPSPSLKRCVSSALAPSDDGDSTRPAKRVCFDHEVRVSRAPSLASAAAGAGAGAGAGSAAPRATATTAASAGVFAAAAGGTAGGAAGGADPRPPSALSDGCAADNAYEFETSTLKSDPPLEVDDGRVFTLSNPIPAGPNDPGGNFRHYATATTSTGEAFCVGGSACIETHQGGPLFFICIQDLFVAPAADTRMEMFVHGFWYYQRDDPVFTRRLPSRVPPPLRARELVISTAQLEASAHVNVLMRPIELLPEALFVERAARERLGSDVYFAGRVFDGRRCFELANKRAPLPTRHADVCELVERERIQHAESESSTSVSSGTPSGSDDGSATTDDTDDDDDDDDDESKLSRSNAPHGAGRKRARAVRARQSRDGKPGGTRVRARARRAGRAGGVGGGVSGARAAHAAAPGSRARALAKLGEAASPLARARVALRLGSMPDSLPCREAQSHELVALIEAAVRSGLGGSAFIGGLPGTGKTVTVREALRVVRARTSAGELPEFVSVELNALTLTSPQQLYPELLGALRGTALVAAAGDAAPADAESWLDAMFERPSPRQHTLVVVVDELDALFSAKQTVLYRLFDWPTRPHARLLVIGIANTVDLPERLLPRVRSRLGIKTVEFRSYTATQLEAILRSRLEGLDAADPAALALVARKVAAFAGDARRALELTRHACELAAQAGAARLTTAHILGAFDAMLASPQADAIAAGSAAERAALVAVYLEARCAGDAASEPVTLAAVFDRHRLLMPAQPRMTSSELRQVVARLAATRLLVAEAQVAGADLRARVRLNVAVDVLQSGLGASPLAAHITAL